MIKISEEQDGMLEDGKYIVFLAAKGTSYTEVVFIDVKDNEPGDSVIYDICRNYINDTKYYAYSEEWYITGITKVKEL